MHWCAAGCASGQGITLVLENGRYVDHMSGATGGVCTVEKFTRESVIIHRTDSGPYPGEALLTGQLSADGNRIVNGIIAWTYHPCCGLSSGTFKAAWGPAIDTVPGTFRPGPATGAIVPDHDEGFRRFHGFRKSARMVV